MKNKITRISILVVCLLVLAGGYYGYTNQEPLKRVLRNAYYHYLIGTESGIPYIGHTRNNAYVLHLKAGKKYGWKPILNKKALHVLVKSGKLIKIKDHNGYKMGWLYHSSPYLTPEAGEMLQEIGRQYLKQSPKKSYFTVSSGTRTVAQQDELSRNNKNATAGISSHSYGCSFDISYIRFDGRRGYNSEKQKRLELILKDLQKRKRILLIKEIGGKCYHITVPPKKKN